MKFWTDLQMIRWHHDPYVTLRYGHCPIPFGSLRIFVMKWSCIQKMETSYYFRYRSTSCAPVSVRIYCLGHSKSSYLVLHTMQQRSLNLADSIISSKLPARLFLEHGKAASRDERERPLTILVYVINKNYFCCCITTSLPTIFEWSTC